MNRSRVHGILSALVLALSGCGPTRKVVRTERAPAAIGPYSQAVVAGDFVFVSGQIAIDPATGALVAGGIEAETDRALRNVAAVLAAAGLSMNDVVQATVYLIDLVEFQAMNRVYAAWFPKTPPARATVEVAALPKGARVEIAVIAHR
jgi:2-iminobutanoate/2-iminopropanoate deaminase